MMNSLFDENRIITYGEAGIRAGRKLVSLLIPNFFYIVSKHVLFSLTGCLV